MAGDDIASSYHVRKATEPDISKIAEIYAYYVDNTVITFEETVPSAEDMAERFRQIQGGGLPYRVAESAGEVVGYAYAATFRARSGYRFTVENSIYLQPPHTRRGLGTLLMQDLIGECTALGFRQMLAVIGDSANDASIGLHRRLGFRLIGEEHAVGLKFGRWVDVVQMQLALGEGDGSVPG